MWLLSPGLAAAATTRVPLPQPRPAGAPHREASLPPPAAAEPAPRPDDKEAPPAAAASPPEPSACRKALTPALATAPSIEAIRGAGGCGGDDLVRLEAVILPSGQPVAMKPAGILRCEMASALVDWIRKDIASLADQLGSRLTEVDNFDSYECRGRNRVVGAKLSEHGKANALDVRGFRLADGRFISLTDRNERREVREKVLASVCARFDTVLGPASDWYHEDHIHLDLAARRGGYKICQWGVFDPMPQAAPAIPAQRPDEAPPREVAGDAGTAAPVSAPGEPNAGASATARPSQRRTVR